MKKTLAVFLSSFLLIGFLSACGGVDEIKQSEEEKVKPKTSKTASTEPTEDKKEDKQKEEDKDVYFKDNEAKLNDLKIIITETKVIPVGETGNEYGEKPVFAIWYETTNLSEKDINPITAWMVVFEAIQDNNPNAVNKIEVAALPDDQFLDTQLETIKQNGTVKNAVAYELDDLETPVTLIATQGIGGDKLGEQTYNIK